MQIAIIGATGIVGRELISLLKAKSFPYSTLDLYASKRNGEIQQLGDPKSYDLVFFCTPSHISKEQIPLWLPHTSLIIDLSSAFRETAPLIIPEINPHHFKPPLICSPNCTTTLMLLALAPLHKYTPIHSIIATTYQAASGGGKALLETLLHQKEPLHHNLFLHENPSEETKMINESRKILDAPDLIVHPTCVRVPIPRVHSLSLHVTFKGPIENPKSLITLPYDPSATPHSVSNTEEVVIGRLRQLTPKTLELWVLGDQLLKGAALNALQIATNYVPL